MSLEGMNWPPLVGALTAGCYKLLALLLMANGHNILMNSDVVSFAAIKGINVLSYAFSVYTVSRPGRYDGEASDNDYVNDDNKKGKAKSSTKKNNDAGVDSDTVVAARREGMKQMGTTSGRTLLPPAPWAFIIWAPIFIGELVMVTAPIVLQGISDSSGSNVSSNAVSPALQQTIRKITGPFLLTQLFQGLWAASFRPKYGSSSIYKYISAFNLAGIALSLSYCHEVFAKSRPGTYSSVEYWLYFLPLTLHFGWTTAAALVNLNGMYALTNSNSSSSNERTNEVATAKFVAALGHVSVLGATAIGVWITWTRKAPVYGGVICWALTAVAAGLQQRINAADAAAETNHHKKTDNNGGAALAIVVGIYGAKRQRILSIVGAVICASTAVAVVLVSK